MSLEKFIKDNVSNIGKECRIYINPNIELKKLNNTLTTICRGIIPEYILAVCDSTVFGSSKEGIVFTSNSFFYRAMLLKPIEFKYEDIEEAIYFREEIEKKTGKNEVKETVTMNLKNGKTVILTNKILNIKLLELTDFINDIIKIWQQGYNLYESTQKLNVI